MSPKDAANAAPPLSRPLLLVLAVARAFRRRSTRSWRRPIAASCPSTARVRWRSRGIHVDVGGPDAQTRALRGLAHCAAAGLPGAVGEDAQCCRSAQAPNLPDGTLDQIVSSINVEREQIGPNRYIADLGVLFDRARSAEFLGVEGGEVQRSVPMLLIPVTVTGGNRDERRAAERLAAGLGAVPDLAEPDRLCPGERPGRRSDAGQRGADEPARPRLVAQYHRSSTARPTSWSRKFSCSGSILAARRARGSSPAMAPTMRSSAASR